MFLVFLILHLSCAPELNQLAVPRVGGEEQQNPAANKDMDQLIADLLARSQHGFSELPLCNQWENWFATIQNLLNLLREAYELRNHPDWDLNHPNAGTREATLQGIIVFLINQLKVFLFGRDDGHDTNTGLFDCCELLISYLNGQMRNLPNPIPRNIDTFDPTKPGVTESQKRTYASYKSLTQFLRILHELKRFIYDTTDFYSELEPECVRALWQLLQDLGRYRYREDGTEVFPNPLPQAPAPQQLRNP